MRFALIGVAAAAIATPAPARASLEGPGHCAGYCANETCGPVDNFIDRFYREDWLGIPYNEFMDPPSHNCRPTHRSRPTSRAPRP